MGPFLRGGPLFQVGPVFFPAVGLEASGCGAMFVLYSLFRKTLTEATMNTSVKQERRVRGSTIATISKYCQFVEELDHYLTPSRSGRCFTSFIGMDTKKRTVGYTELNRCPLPGNLYCGLKIKDYVELKGVLFLESFVEYGFSWPSTMNQRALDSRIKLLYLYNLQ